MDDPDEPPPKRAETDFKLCIYCQEDTNDTLVDPEHKLFRCSSYNTFLDSVKKKAYCKNPDFVRVAQRLYNVDANQLKSKKATWHRGCYTKVTLNFKRDKDRYDKAVQSNNVAPVVRRKRGRPSTPSKIHSASTSSDLHTRSKTPAYDSQKCVFCQSTKHTGSKLAGCGERCTNSEEVLFNCRSSNRGKDIEEIVKASGDQIWEIRLANVLQSGDLLSRDVVYHHSCFTLHWTRHMRKLRQTTKENDEPPSEDQKIEVIAGEVQFLCSVQDKIDEGKFLSMPDLENMYHQAMGEVGIADPDRRVLQKMLLDNLDNVAITQSLGRTSSQVHSKDAASAAVHTAASAQKSSSTRERLKRLFKCSKQIRHLICDKGRDWTFTGSLKDTLNEGIPEELLIFIQWIIKGHRQASTAQREDDITRSASLIAQNILQAFKTDRQVNYKPPSDTASFRNMYETPPAVGLSLYSHHMHRSKDEIKVLRAANVGVSYDRVNEITTQIAKSTLQVMEANSGAYIPTGLRKGIQLRASIDNIDAKVDTTDGRDSFHGTACSIYQNVPANATNIAVCEPLSLGVNTSCKGLGHVPPTVISLHPCSIRGIPRPSNSPKYEDYRLGQHQHEVDHAKQHDFTWLLARYLQRPKEYQPPEQTVTQELEEDNLDEGSASLCNANTLVNQAVPLWRAYNSMLCSEENHYQRHVDSHYSLPIINAPANEWPTLVTALERLHHLNALTCPDKEGRIMVTLDMDLYKRALKLEYLEDSYAAKWFLLPGPFHTSLCAIRCLGKCVEHSGLDEAWVQSGLYGRVVVNQIINGTHYNRAVTAHEVSLQVMFDLWIEEFFRERPQVKDAITEAMENIKSACQTKDKLKEAHQQFLIQIEGLNLEKQLHEFDQSRAASPLYRWARMYMRQVGALLHFHRSIKNPQLFLYLASLENLATYFFAYNRLDYSQNILEFVARVYDAKDTNPEIWESMLNGEFATTTRNIPFTSIGLDQAQEHDNKNIKGDGGIKGITTNPSALLKYCLAAPELSRIANEFRDMINIPDNTTDIHHQLSQAKTEKQEHEIQALKAVIGPCNIFSKQEDANLFNFMTKQLVTVETKTSILQMEDRGVRAKNDFVDSRICNDENLWKRMSKLKFQNWDEICKNMKLKGHSEVMHLKAASTMLSRLLVVAKSQRQLDLEEVISYYELNVINSTLMNTDGHLLACKNKSLLIHALEGYAKDGEDNKNLSKKSGTNELESSSQVESPPNQSSSSYQKHLIIDAMAVVQAVISSPGKTFNTFKDIARDFVTSISSLLFNYAAGRVIFDNYDKKITLKDDIRYTTKGEDLVITDSTPVKDIKKVMASSKSKDSLTLFLADKLITHCTKPVVTVTRRDVLINKSHLECRTGQSTHEEADTLMILHGLELAQTGIEVDFFTQDTDWWVLLLKRLPEIGFNTYILTGTYDNRRLVDLKPIYDELGSSVAMALPGFHAITGSDTTGRISGVGKKTAVAKLVEAPESVTKALTDLGKGPTPSPEVVCGCEEFICMLLSTKDIAASTAASLRWKKFKKLKPSQGIDKLPPTPGAILQHIYRAHLQASIWAQDNILHPVIYNPCTLGWCKSGSQLVPVLTSMECAPESVAELVRCNCVKSQCSTMRCTCRRNGLECTELCKCNAAEDCCNTLTVPNMGEEDR